MNLVFDICQGVGVATAVGIRPFLPALVTGALAAADVELSFRHTHFHFLQQLPFLVVMIVGVALLGVLEARRATGSRALPVALSVIAVAIGALLCGGAFAREHHLAVVGIVAGVLCAGVGVAATQPLLGRVRARLDADAGGVLPWLVDGAAALGAALSVLAPPVGVILLAGLLWLLAAGRGRSDQKYAGLRILR